jgi:hypothetical protein
MESANMTPLFTVALIIINLHGGTLAVPIFVDSMYTCQADASVINGDQWKDAKAYCIVTRQQPTEALK